MYMYIGTYTYAYYYICAKGLYTCAYIFLYVHIHICTDKNSYLRWDTISLRRVNLGHEIQQQHINPKLLSQISALPTRCPKNKHYVRYGQ